MFSSNIFAIALALFSIPFSLSAPTTSPSHDLSSVHENKGKLISGCAFVDSKVKLNVIGEVRAQANVGVCVCIELKVDVKSDVNPACGPHAHEVCASTPYCACDGGYYNKDGTCEPIPITCQDHATAHLINGVWTCGCDIDFELGHDKHGVEICEAVKAGAHV